MIGRHWWRHVRPGFEWPHPGLIVVGFLVDVDNPEKTRWGIALVHRVTNHDWSIALQFDRRHFAFGFAWGNDR